MIKCDNTKCELVGSALGLTVEAMIILDRIVDLIREVAPKEEAERVLGIVFDTLDEKLHGEQKLKKPNPEEAFKAAEFLNDFFESIEKANK